MLKESDSGFIYKSIKGVLVKKFYNFRKILESFAYVANERLHSKQSGWALRNQIIHSVVY